MLLQTNHDYIMTFEASFFMQLLQPTAEENTGNFAGHKNMEGETRLKKILA